VLDNGGVRPDTGPAMTRVEFQLLAEVRLKEAEVLLAAGLWDGAYYLAGYAVECGLKACIAKKTKAEEFPDKSFAQKCFTHDLEVLLELADLDLAFAADWKVDPVLETNWKLTCRWDESFRYSKVVPLDAQTLVTAISDPKSGVFQWIKRHW
jgi:hypothetical protein